jgi:hypothetical protein
MTDINGLETVKAGDDIALECGGTYHTRYRKVKVTKVTPTQIFLGNSRFRKSDGKAIGKNVSESISLISTDIQSDWDRKEYTQELRQHLESKEIPAEKLKEAVVVMTTGSEWYTDESRKAIVELLELKQLSIEALRQAVAILK